MTNKKTEEKILMVGNWKMNPVKVKEAETLATDIKKAIAKMKHVEVVVCPSLIHIPHIEKITKTGQLVLGSQNVAHEEKGSLTGEVSVLQLSEYGVKYCIVGHSERRFFGETNESIARKIELLIKKNITPILCIGEQGRDEKGNYLHDIENQLKLSLSGLSKKIADKVVIAYEPLWAIGKTAARSATKEEIEEVVILIRRTLSDLYAMKSIPQNKILYGGSVGNKKDVAMSISKGYISGCLVGLASLASKTFIPLIEEANRLMTE